MRALRLALLVLAAPACALVVGLEDKERAGADASDGATSAEGGGSAVETLATQQDHPTSLALDATHVYWVNEGGQLRRRAKGPTAVPETMAQGLATPRWIAVDGQYAFWAATNAPQVKNDAGAPARQIIVGRVDKTRPNQPEEIYGGDYNGNVRLLALFDGYGASGSDAASASDGFIFTVFSQSSNNDAVRRYARTGNSNETNLAQNQDGVSALAADETRLYWAVRQTRELRARLKDGNVQPDRLATLPDIATDLAVDPAFVYALLANGAVYRVDTSRPDSLERVTQAPAGGQRLAVDDARVYFTIGIDGDANGQVYTALKSPGGDPPTLLASFQGEPRGVAVEQDPLTRKKSVYFVARSEGSVKRVALP